MVLCVDEMIGDWLSEPSVKSIHGYAAKATQLPVLLPDGVWYPSPLGLNGARNSTHSMLSSRTTIALRWVLPTMMAPRSWSRFRHGAVSDFGAWYSIHARLQRDVLKPSISNMSFPAILTPRRGLSALFCELVYDLEGTTTWSWFAVRVLSSSTRGL